MMAPQETNLQSNILHEHRCKYFYQNINKSNLAIYKGIMTKIFKTDFKFVNQPI